LHISIRDAKSAAKIKKFPDANKFSKISPTGGSRTRVDFAALISIIN